MVCFLSSPLLVIVRLLTVGFGKPPNVWLRAAPRSTSARGCRTGPLNQTSPAPRQARESSRKRGRRHQTMASYQLPPKKGGLEPNRWFGGLVIEGVFHVLPTRTRGSNPETTNASHQRSQLPVWFLTKRKQTSVKREARVFKGL